MSDRRSFLRGLASLPLIGGGMTLIGNPTAAAVPATPELMNRYRAWLAREWRQASVEHQILLYPEHFAAKPDLFTWDFVPTGFIPNDAVAHADHMMWMADPDRTGIEGTAGLAEIVKATKPSSRAAVALSAVGCPLTGGAHD